MDVRKILIAVDYSSDSQQALLWGMSLAEKYGSGLLFFHVIPKAIDEVFPHGIGVTSPPAYYLQRMAPGNRPFAGQPIIIDLVDKALTELQDFAQKHLKAPRPQESRVGVGKPAEEILRVAREEAVDLIVMGTHGHTGLRHLLLGSVAEEVTRHAPCPVFTIRRQGEADEGLPNHARASAGSSMRPRTDSACNRRRSTSSTPPWRFSAPGPWV